MPASGISSELSAHQMALAEAIAHSRALLCPRASSLSFSSLVSPLRPLGLGFLGRCDPRSFIFSASLRTQVRPAIEFVSGKEGLRPRIAVFAGIAVFMPYDVTLRVLVFFEFVYWDTLKFASAPGLSGGRGEMAMPVASSARLAFFVVRSAPVVRRTPDAFPFLVPVQQQSTELPATNVGACRRHTPCEDTRRTLDCPFNFRPPRIVAGWFFILCRRDPLA